MEVDEEGYPVAVTSEAFRVDEDGISTNWVEFEGGGLEAACLLMAAVRTVRLSHRVGVFNVGEAIAVGQSARRTMRAIHDPIEDPPPNPGHALLTGVLPSDTDLLDQLALLVSLEPFPIAAMHAPKR
jgi:hypothetical protein